MGLGTALMTLISNNFNILGTSVLAVFLLLLEKLVEGEFTCPENSVLRWLYSLSFICVPILVLLFLGCKFCCSEGCSRCCNPYTWVRILTAPVIWFFIVLADGRYVACLTKHSFSTENDILIKPAVQMIGLWGIGVLIVLSLFLPSCNCCKNFMKTWYRSKYEQKLVNKIEKHLREQAKEKLKTAAQKLAEPTWHDSMYVNIQLDQMKDLEENIFDIKERTKQRCMEVIKDPKRARPANQDNDRGNQDNDQGNQDNDRANQDNDRANQDNDRANQDNPQEMDPLRGEAHRNAVNTE